MVTNEAPKIEYAIKLTATKLPVHFVRALTKDLVVRTPTILFAVLSKSGASSMPKSLNISAVSLTYVDSKIKERKLVTCVIKFH